MKKNQWGFAALEAILIVVIVALIGGIGWYVWDANNKTNETLVNADAANSSTLSKVVIKTYEDCLKSKTSTLDKKSFPQTCTTKTGKKFSDPNPSASWKAYASKTGRYALKHPAAWQEDVCDPTATDLTLYLGPTKASSVICNSEHLAQITVVSTSAVPTTSEQTLGSSYTSVTSKKVTVDGVSGIRQSGKLKAAEDGPTAIPAGTLVVRYFFLAPGRSYILVYVQSPSGDYSANNLDAFDYMAQKTLSFTK